MTPFPSLPPLLALALILGAVPGASGQPVATVAELATILRVGQTVTVVATDGVQVRGRLIRITSGQLVLRLPSQTYTVTSDRVRQVSRCCDSLVNGLLIGGLSLGALGFASALKFSGEVRAGDGVAGFLMFGAIGAGVGTCIDALNRDQVVVYQNRIHALPASLGWLHRRRAPGSRVRPLGLPHMALQWNVAF